MTAFFQLLFQGLALGSVYALVAVGFTVIYRASQVINFAQGSLLLLGAYLISVFATGLNLPFALAVVVTIVVLAAGCVAFQMVVLQRVLGQPVFVLVMITIGLSIAPPLTRRSRRSSAATPASSATRGAPRPCTRAASRSTGCASASSSAPASSWRCTSCSTASHVTGWPCVRRPRTRRAPALAVGVPIRRVYALTWAIAGGVAVVGGMFLSGFPSSVNPSLGDVALRAFPAIILGGLDSLPGAVVVAS